MFTKKSTKSFKAKNIAYYMLYSSKPLNEVHVRRSHDSFGISTDLSVNRSRSVMYVSVAQGRTMIFADNYKTVHILIFYVFPSVEK